MHAKTLKIVEAAGTSAANPIAAHMIEDAMTEAVMQCVKEGVNDPAEILRRKMLARDKVKRG